VRGHLFLVVYIRFFLIGSIFSFNALADGWDPTSKAPNDASIVNTRHNLTMSYLGSTSIMDFFRNNYTEVCVYCHTPHAANSQIDAPLWNRTINTSQYTVYDKPRMLNQPIGQPGPNSLTCLSCHDGTIAVDSIINMPGSGLYDKNQETDSQIAFLNTWGENGGAGSGNHLTLSAPSTGFGCLACHSSGIGTIPDFTAFALGTDLTDDHPIGILYPDEFGPGYDFAEPDVIITGRLSFFDLNGNGFPNANDVRLYDTGDGPKVECASCHDPHGVPSGTKGTKFNPSFLRVNNGIVDNGSSGTSGIVSAGPSALCLTCHTK